MASVLILFSLNPTFTVKHRPILALVFLVMTNINETLTFLNNPLFYVGYFKMAVSEMNFNFELNKLD